LAVLRNPNVSSLGEKLQNRLECRAGEASASRHVT
jgi:hypothetical protein